MNRILTGVIAFFIFAIASHAQVAITHTVRSGESLYGIAKQYGISVDVLKKANPEMGDYFYAGMVLNIPAKIDSSSDYVSKADSLEKHGTYIPPAFLKKIAESKMEKKNEVKDIVNTGLMYWGFDGYDNYGFFREAIGYNNVGVEFAIRTKFEKHSNYNTELGLNYSLGLFRQDNSAAMLTATFCPLSLRWQDEYDYKSGKYANKGFLDAYYSIRLTLKLGKVVLTGGYFNWAPKWEFGKDYKMDGYCIGLMYSANK